MPVPLYENATFENTDFSEQEIPDGEFVKCTFINCNFSKSNLRSTDFIDCEFKICNFSQSVLDNTGLKNVKFRSCKLMGLNFSACSDFLFAVSFNDCHIDYASFYKKKMKKTIFTNCSLKEVDFQETDLSAAAFHNCDLFLASFIQSNLEKADFRTAINYTFDPAVNKVKKAKFSYSGISGLLTRYDIDIEFN